MTAERVPGRGNKDRFLHVDPPYLPNRIAEHVVASVGRFDRLRPTLRISGDEKFSRVLTASVQRSRIGDQVGITGGTLVTSPLVDNDDVVIKERIGGTESDIIYWQERANEQGIVEYYFGRRFVPYTEFATAKIRRVGERAADTSSKHVMIQERIWGEEYDPEFATPREVSPALKGEMIEFIHRYEYMMRREDATIDNEIMFNDNTGEVKISDTNFFIRFDMNNRHIRRFFEEFHIDPESVHSSQDIIREITSSIPELTFLGDQGYDAFIDAFNNHEDIEKSERISVITSTLNKRHGDSVVLGLNSLVRLVEDFAPPGHHNLYITGMMKNFGIDESEL